MSDPKVSGPKPCDPKPSDLAVRDPRLAAIFDALADAVGASARHGEVLFAALRAERADYLRVNRSRVRQAGTVERAIVTLRLLRDDRQALMHCTLGAPSAAGATVRGALRELRSAIARLPADPFAAFDREPAASERVSGGNAPEPAQVVEAIVDAAGDDDVVGLYAGGPVVQALASNLGHRHYHEARSSSFDFSVHVPATRAVKRTWTSAQWDADSLRASVAAARARAALLLRPARVVAPGRYRVLLSARAVACLVDLLSWGGFSERAFRSGQSPLARAQRGEVRFHPAFALSEEPGKLGVPLFRDDGFLRPASLALIDAGRPSQRLCSPRSAREFGIATNGADDEERPLAASVAPGALAEDAALSALRNGIAIDDLWYLNYSDRQSCRATGMTRFATSWVENGERVAPIDAMRFDDSLYRVFGEGLLGLTDTPHLVPHVETWEGRDPRAIRAPSALVDALRFTL